MQQRFFETTLESKYIKYLLSYTPLPIFPTISSDDIIIEGCTYIYKDKILKCTKTGRFVGINSNHFIDDHLYVNDRVYVTDDPDAVKRYVESPDGTYGFTKDDYLTVTDDVVRQYYRPIAEYEIQDDFLFGNYTPNITQRFVSNVSYYDSTTHRFLGEYLRCLRDIYDVDLMCLYNCFDYDMADNISLTDYDVIESKAVKSKVFIIPIKFNKTYTIAVDCPSPVRMKSIFYNDKLLKDSYGFSLTDDLQESVVKFPNLQFSSPVTYSVSNDTQIDTRMIDTSHGSTYEEELDRLRDEKIKRDRKLQNHEKYLYLAIQLPETNNSSIVVLEGDYKSVSKNYVSDASGVEKISTLQQSQIFRSKLSLLESNDHLQSPYSDKLISYLLRHTIDNREYIDDNVSTIETKIDYRPPLRDFYSGQWDNSLRYTLYNKYMKLQNVDYIDKLDILGYVDRDVENAVQKGLIHYGV